DQAESDGAAITERCARAEGGHRLCAQIAFETLEVVPQFGGRLVARLTLLLQTFGDDGVKGSQRAGIQFGNRRWIAVQYAIENYRAGYAFEGRPSGAHFIDHGAEGEQVGGRVQF